MAFWPMAPTSAARSRRSAERPAEIPPPRVFANRRRPSPSHGLSLGAHRSSEQLSNLKTPSTMPRSTAVLLLVFAVAALAGCAFGQDDAPSAAHLIVHKVSGPTAFGGSVATPIPPAPPGALDPTLARSRLSFPRRVNTIEDRVRASSLRVPLDGLDSSIDWPVPDPTPTALTDPARPHSHRAVRGREATRGGAEHDHQDRRPQRRQQVSGNDARDPSLAGAGKPLAAGVFRGFPRRTDRTDFHFHFFLFPCLASRVERRKTDGALPPAPSRDAAAPRTRSS